MEGEIRAENVLLVEKQNRVCTITFNRPERRNALSPALLLQLSEYIDQLKKEDEIRCVVFRGAGDKAFSPGYDITALPTETDPEAMEARRKRNPYQLAIETIRDFPYPIIAMINGVAFGAGCEIAITCDIRIAVNTARLGMPPAKLGLVYSPGGLMRFINVIGLPNAKEMFFTGRSYSAERAREMGLVHYLLPSDQLIPFTYEMAHEISGNAPLSLKGMKTIFNLCLKHQRFDPEEIKQMEMLIAEAFASEDLKEGKQSFLEKRKPIFRGK
jgi:enoyl-CoA hydratase